MSIRIAHFSDLHVLSLEGVPIHRFVNKRFTGYANLRFRRKHIHREGYVRAIAREITAARVDHVAITGDLTNLALESEFELARTLLEHELGLPPENVSIVPGNHDLYTRGALLSRRFSTFFGHYLMSDLPELAVDIGVGHFPFVKLRGPVAIIGVSSAVPRLPFMAAGLVGDAQLGALQRIVDHPEVMKRTPVILMHHPIHNSPSRLKAILEGLHDAHLLLETLDNLRRGLALHGHVHHRVHRTHPTRHGHVQSIGATSASLHHAEGGRMAGFNLYKIDDTGHVAEIEAHVFNPITERFHVEGVPKFV